MAHYRAKARAVARLGIAIGGTAGAAVGSVPLSPLRAAWPIPTSFGIATLLGGLVVGVLIGYVIGDGRARLYQRMAEQARLQLQLEERISESDIRMNELLAALTARAAAAVRAEGPPAEEPETQPLVVLPEPEPHAAPTAYPYLRTVRTGPAPSGPQLAPPPA